METIVRYFTFFTILTNIMVAVVFTVNWLQPKNIFSFFRKPNVQTAIGVYIFIVGFICNIILRFLWQPQGLQRLVDESLHTVIPIIYCVYWFLKVDKTSLNWKNIFGLLIYPMIYCIVVMIRGNFSNYYPYPFIDVTKLEFNNAVLNCFYLTLFFAFVALVFVGVARFKTNRLSKGE